MKTYTLIDRATRKSYQIQAQNKDDLRIKASKADLPKSKFSVRDSNGEGINIVIDTTKDAKQKRGFIPKEQYDQLYYIMNDRQYDLCNMEGRDPLVFASRRYDTLDEVRKAAIARSKKNMKDYIDASTGPWPHLAKTLPGFSVMVFKGRRYMGFVTVNPSKSKMLPYTATWSPAENPKDEIPLGPDGARFSRRL